LETVSDSIYTADAYATNEIFSFSDIGGVDVSFTAHEMN